MPYHFGLESGRRACAEAVRREDGLVAVEDGEVVGFLTVVRHFDASAEITWLAVRDDRRRRGIGGRLVEELAAALAAERRRLLVVLTVSPSDPDDEVPDGYGATRRFYAGLDFDLACDLPGLWDPNVAVLLVRVLGA